MGKTKVSFSRRVLKAVAGIPRGKTMTYKEVARRAGNAKAARAVGNILNRNWHACKARDKRMIPCHRVVRSDGTIGGYARGRKIKREILIKEKAI